MISHKFLRSSAVASFSLLTLFACERTERQGEDAAEDMSGPTPATGTTETEGPGTTGSRDTMEGTGTERSPGTGSAADTTSSEAIERTGGRDMPMPMGSGGSYSGAMRMGTGGGGKAGAGGKGSSAR